MLLLKVRGIIRDWYMLCMPIFRTNLWKYLSRFGTNLDIPWIMLRDFNQVVSIEDKKGGMCINEAGRNSLHLMLERCGLLDLGFVGPHIRTKSLLGTSFIENTAT